ncbi:TrkA C-terminal domain-containing protein [Chloroflexota bacterium]
MGFLVPTLLIIFVSFLIVRAAAIALMITGMDQTKARFQALSAFSGTGFTTREAESIVNHPVRRRIATWLMILGNAGIVMVIVTATTSVVTTKGYQLAITVAVLIVGTYLVIKLGRHRGLTRRWERFIARRFIKSRLFAGRIVENLTNVSGDYEIVRAFVTEDSPLLGASIAQANLQEHESYLLGIERGDKWISLPQSDEKVLQGDNLVVYGLTSVLERLFRPEKRTA